MRCRRYQRSAATCAAGYKQECAKQGIAGAAVRQELLQLVAQVRPRARPRALRRLPGGSCSAPQRAAPAPA
jgi:hypothetical protein